MPDKDHPYACFKSVIPARPPRIVSTVCLTQAHLAGEDVKELLSDCRALWDTGAEVSTIDDGLAKKLSLPAIARRRMYGAGGIYEANVYLAGLIIPHALSIPSIRLTGFAGSGYFDMLFGMDIILRGDFLISPANSKIYFSFTIPPLGGFHLDTIQKINLQN